MSAANQAIAIEAAGLVGAPFRLHGRDERTGIDCVGLILLSMQRAGLQVPELTSYSLRNLHVTALLPSAKLMGFHDVSGLPQPGDVFLFKVAAAQFHLGIVSKSGEFIHAHAALRRVVKSPFPANWILERHWRL